MRSVDCVFKSYWLIAFFSRSVQEFSVRGLVRRSTGGGGFYGLVPLPQPADLVFIHYCVCADLCDCGIVGVVKLGVGALWVRGFACVCLRVCVCLRALFFA